MNNKQKVLYLTLLIIFIALMIWLFIEKEYVSIIKSICIFAGSFIFGAVWTKLGIKNDEE